MKAKFEETLDYLGSKYDMSLEDMKTIKDLLSESYKDGVKNSDEGDDFDDYDDDDEYDDYDYGDDDPEDDFGD